MITRLTGIVVDDIIEAIRKDGVVVIDDGVEDVPRLKSEALTALKHHGKPYAFGKAIHPGGWTKQYLGLEDFFNQEWMKTIFQKYQGRKQRSKEVMITNEFKNEGQIGRNGYLHFDRGWCFKYFLYLTDVDEQCGPFCCIPGTHTKGKELREKAWKTTKKYPTVKNRLEIDYPTLGFKSENAEPVLGPAGTLVIFDTDTFHFGGHTDGKERLVVRSHLK